MIDRLNHAGVEYVIVGAFAVAYHGYPRGSQDIDFFFNPCRKNTKKLFSTLDDFFEGGFHPDTSYEDIQEGAVIGFGRGFQRTEFLSDIDGVDYSEVDSGKEILRIPDGIEVPVIGLDELIKNKSSTGRPKDRGDVDELKKIHTEVSTDNNHEGNG